MRSDAESYFVRKALRGKERSNLQPSRKLAAVWQARLGVLFFLLFFPLWLLVRRYPAAGALSITVLTGVCLMIWALIPHYCKRLHYQLGEEGITVTRGLFFARMIHLPRPQSLYTCIYRTPFYRLAGLYGVALWGAGMHTLLPGMTQEQAQAVLSLLARAEQGGGT